MASGQPNSTPLPPSDQPNADKEEQGEKEQETGTMDTTPLDDAAHAARREVYGAAPCARDATYCTLTRTHARRTRVWQEKRRQTLATQLHHLRQSWDKVELSRLIPLF